MNLTAPLIILLCIFQPHTDNPHGLKLPSNKINPLQRLYGKQSQRSCSDKFEKNQQLIFALNDYFNTIDAHKNLKNATHELLQSNLTCLLIKSIDDTTSIDYKNITDIVNGKINYEDDLAGIWTIRPINSDND